MRIDRNSLRSRLSLEEIAKNRGQRSDSNAGTGFQVQDGFDRPETRQADASSSSTDRNGIGGLISMGIGAIGGFLLSKVVDKLLGKSKGSDQAQGTSASGLNAKSSDASTFPDASSVICESVTSEGTGAYHGTAGFLFPPSWLGKIESVKMGDEVGQMGTPWNGQEICRFLKPGHEYTWPQTLTIKAGGQTYSMQVTEQMMLGTSSSGAATSGTSSTSGTSGGSFDGTTEKLDGYGGFLWKPTSENDGKLVVLLPSKYAGKVKSVEVQDAQGNTLETGKYSANANGGRDHFRFGKSGSSFGDNVYVVATLSSGEKVRYPVAHGGSRTD
ncbi:MAG: hypothetical protein HY901_00970 [Deltaproteobacteria bacterium]|nr:hypothetical protein [Deltaproteobacteria bacterium]